ncbi:efflux RND transporter periplasmic adaptor subunit [Aliidiomarina taiwanensis]|uniref:Efflux RND transporter periplasmic adaptor subunit n=1 Tax=Aliidiomarina taiwanensis TaxID=946228 RepID=A0A432X7U3_9GAMM|nr:efflux RND transporter periplasmic adaptor subunit [Aliidiomarina taiwanensis]RUO42915.1 efflux RND transporter periplasmic adaptor subunit [Aliidiomarina taiwanensis]
MATLVRFLFVLSISLFVLTGCGETRTQTALAEQVERASVNEYTCSMHPSVRTTDPNARCPICGMDLIPVQTSVATDSHDLEVQLDLSQRGKALADVGTTPVQLRNLSKVLTAVGKVTWNSRTMRTLSAWTDGRLDTLYINAVGDQVTKGQAVAQLYSPELITAQQEYLDALRQTQQVADKPTLSESAQRILQAAERRLALLGVPTSHIQALAQQPHVSTHIDIQSPLAGVVTETFVREGQYVKTGEPIATVADPSVMWVVLDVFQHDLQWVHTGQQVRLQLPHQSEPVVANVVEVLPELNGQQIGQVRVEFDARDMSVRPGSFVTAEIAVVEDEQTLAVPHSAVLFTGPRSLVYVADPDQPGVFAQRQVVLGARFDDYYQVVEGLAEGEFVVNKGNFRIDSELQLQGNESMMSQTAAGSAQHDHSLHKQDQHAEHVMHAMDMPAMDQTVMLDHEAAHIFPPYFAMWEALKSDQLDAWHQAAADFFAAVETVEWPTELAAIQADLLYAREHLHHVSDIAQARDQFFIHSKGMIKLARMGVHEGEVYRAHCPMARANQGADWLQPTNELLNPYYGSSMLRCGSVEEHLGGHTQ